MTPNPELVVLTGVHEGARVALRAGVCVIGSAPECDVALADAGVRSIHAAVHVAGDALALRRWGDADTADGGASERPVARFEPFRIADVWLAVVPADFAWGVSCALPGAAIDDGGDGAGDDAAHAFLQRRPARRVGPAAALVAAAMVVAVGVVAGDGRLGGELLVVSRAPSSSAPTARAVAAPVAVDPAAAALAARERHDGIRRAIDALGLRGVALDTSTEPPVVSGFVANHDELQALARSVGRHTVLRVQVGAELVRRAREFLADPRIDATYEPRGRLVLSGRAASTAPQALALARRVRQLADDLGTGVSVDDRIDYGEVMAQPPPPKEQPMLLRIVEVQADEPAFFRTAEGGKYFIGARMPDGAEVVAVGAEEIRFRKNGRAVSYRVLE